MTNTQASAKSSAARNSRRGEPVPQTAALGVVLDLGLMKAPHQRRRNVAVVGMIIVAGPVKIGRHHRDEIGAMLQPIGLAQFDAGDLGDGVPLIARLQRARKQHVGRHRLRRQPRIDAGRAEIDELLDGAAMRGANGIERDRDIVGEEVGGEGRVGADATDLAGSDEDGIGLGLRHEALDCIRLPQIEVLARGENDVAVFAFKPAHDRGTGHAGMPGDEDSLAA